MNITILSIYLIISSVALILISCWCKKLLKENEEVKEVCDETSEKYDKLVDEYNKLSIEYQKMHQSYKDVKGYYEKMYNQITNAMKGVTETPQTFHTKYNMDEILNEINEKGIENIDKEKIIFLNNIKKQR